MPAKAHIERGLAWKKWRTGDRASWPGISPPPDSKRKTHTERLNQPIAASQPPKGASKPAKTRSPTCSNLVTQFLPLLSNPCIAIAGSQTRSRRDSCYVGGAFLQAARLHFRMLNQDSGVQRTQGQISGCGLRIAGKAHGFCVPTPDLVAGWQGKDCFPKEWRCRSIRQGGLAATSRAWPEEIIR